MNRGIIIEVSNEKASVPSIQVMEISLNEENQNNVKASDILSCDKWVVNVCACSTFECCCSAYMKKIIMTVPGIHNFST